MQVLRTFVLIWNKAIIFTLTCIMYGFPLAASSGWSWSYNYSFISFWRPALSDLAKYDLNGERITEENSRDGDSLFLRIILCQYIVAVERLNSVLLLLGLCRSEIGLHLFTDLFFLLNLFLFLSLYKHLLLWWSCS